MGANRKPCPGSVAHFRDACFDATASLMGAQPYPTPAAWRALGMPASMLLLTAQGVWRGLGDTRPPLVATVICTVVNIALDWLFIFPLGVPIPKP